MKGTRNHTDLGSIFDEIFEAAQEFQNEFNRGFGQWPFSFGKHFFDENTDFYPNYSYPPMNVYMTGECTMVFEFALAGFSEKDISLSFQGDYMIFSAKVADNAGGGIPGTGHDDENHIKPAEKNIHYLKRRLKMKDIEKQKYFVPLDKYAQEKVKAVYKNGILKISIPPKDEPDCSEGVKIEIVSEDG